MLVICSQAWGHSLCPREPVTVFLLSSHQPLIAPQLEVGPWDLLSHSVLETFNWLDSVKVFFGHHHSCVFINSLVTATGQSFTALPPSSGSSLFSISSLEKFPESDRERERSHLWLNTLSLALSTWSSNASLQGPLPTAKRSFSTTVGSTTYLWV